MILMNPVKGVKFVGLDIETTGTDPRKHEIIQIGMCTLRPWVHGPIASSLQFGIGWDKFEYEQSAMDINKISLHDIAVAPRAHQIDPILHEWLDKMVLNPGHPLGEPMSKDRIWAVGWNVGSFDMAFFARTFEKSSDLFSYRSVDLNAVAVSLSAFSGLRLDKIKDKAKKYAENSLREAGLHANWHNARYDALASVLAWEWLLSEIYKWVALDVAERAIDAINFLQ